MRKCLVCKRNIKPGELLIAVYDPKTQYHYHFCGWRHSIKWWVLRILKRLRRSG